LVLDQFVTTCLEFAQDEIALDGIESVHVEELQELGGLDRALRVRNLQELQEILALEEGFEVDCRLFRPISSRHNPPSPFARPVNRRKRRPAFGSRSSKHSPRPWRSERADSRFRVHDKLCYVKLTSAKAWQNPVPCRHPLGFHRLLHKQHDLLWKCGKLNLS